jgi:hypothetical protein
LLPILIEKGKAMMKRHYFKKHLKNPSNQFTTILPSVWDLPSYEVARFGGELSKVMLEAAKHYISEKSLLKQQTLFEQTAFQDKSGP